MGERIKSPPSFETCFESPEGRYRIHYRPIDEWDGVLEVSIGSLALTWHVLTVEQEDSITRICGMTHGTMDMWGDAFWFEMICGARPQCIRYWVDRVVWREDPAITN